MARRVDSVVAEDQGLGRWLLTYLPWVLVGGGIALALFGLVAASLGLAPLQWLLVCASVVCAVGTAQARFRAAGWGFMDRLETSALLALAGMIALLNYLGMKQEWDSGRLFFTAATLLALVSAVVVLLPSVARRVVISLLLIFHFGGMVSAITSIDPPGAAGPWLAKQMWMRVYRPYLEFLYMTNAYHFYSPNPGEPSLLWFAVQYTDNTYAWVKLPDRENSPVGMHYQRMLALPEHVFTPQPRLPFKQEERLLVLQQTGQLPTQDSWELIEENRRSGSLLPYRPPIPMVLDMDASLQYREPADTSKRLMASVAAHVFHHPPEEGKRKGKEVRSVKFYRVTQSIVSPRDLIDGRSPLDKRNYRAYFMGEFDGDGNLKDPKDPFLYWYLPIIEVDHNYPAGYMMALPNRPDRQIPVVRVFSPAPTSDSMWLDCVELHAAGYIRPPAEPKKP
jgi:hypothetical protein